MIELKTDIAIIGAGPAGAATSIFLAKKGVNHIILDKAVFPRDKVCGDGLSGKTVSLLKELNKGIIENFVKNRDIFYDSWGVRFVAPNGRGVNIPFSKNGQTEAHPPGFVVRRKDFDQFLIKRIDKKYARSYFGLRATAVQQSASRVHISCQNGTKELLIKTKVVVGAEGDRSLVAKTLAGYRLQPENYFAGLRAYYENVSNLHKDHFIELHFMPETLPGYIWIFPLSRNQANVGIGMLSSDIRRKKINLRRLFFQALSDNPEMRRRFSSAKLIKAPMGWGMPLGSSERKCSGERFLLTGDAGSLIDPFTGEGIGNALLSGKLAANVLQHAVEKQDFSASFLSAYDQALQNELQSELRLSHRIQRLVQFPWLFNFVVNRVRSSQTWQETFSAMFNDLDIRAQLRSPAFYLKLLFQK